MSAKPDLYEKGTAFMWTDEYISKQLLKIHLDPDLDLGSRKMSTVRLTADWILETQAPKKNLKILDLGCGPGLYTEIFTKQGHQVTGVDISTMSIEYAKLSAEKKKLDIAYINANYLELELEAEQFDLIVMIYTDLGVLLPAERVQLLSMIHRVLKKGGTLIFDVLRDNDLEEKMTAKNWTAAGGGFWRAGPHIALSESFLYKTPKVILYQHIVIDGTDQVDLFRFWTHFFSESDLERLLMPRGFTDLQFRRDILPPDDKYSGDNVIFGMASKP